MKIEGGLYPNRMCDYLSKMPQKFDQFYEKLLHVNNAETPELKASQSIAALYGYYRLDDSMFDEFVWYSVYGASVNKVSIPVGSSIL